MSQASRQEPLTSSRAPETSIPTESTDPRRWLMLAVVLAAPFMAIFDQFVVNVAIPTMQRDLHASFGAIQFVIAGYSLAYAVLLITGGRLGDIYGRRRLFLLGMAGFTLASALCGLAPSPEALVGFRIVQGAAAALMSPQVLAIMQVTFTGKHRTTAFGAYGAVLGIAGVLGQVLGGLMIQADLFHLSWRTVFLVNVPIGLVAIPTALSLVPETRAPNAWKLDIGGVAVVSVGLFLLAYPLVAGRDAGWPWWTWPCLALSIPVLVIFARFERWQGRRGIAPLMDLTLFDNQAFCIGLIVILLFYAANGGYFLILALTLQVGLHFSPLEAGLTFFPDAIGFFVAASLSAKLVRRLGARLLNVGVACKIVGLTVVLLIVRHFGVSVQGAQLVPWLFIQGFGSGCVAGTRSGNVGSAAGVLTTVQQVAGAIGVAVVGILFFGMLAAGADDVATQAVPTVQLHLGGPLARAPVGLGRPPETIADFRACVHDRAAARDPADTPASCTRPDLMLADPDLSATLTADVTRAVTQSYTNAFVASLACIIATLVIICGIIFLLPTARPE